MPEKRYFISGLAFKVTIEDFTSLVNEMNIPHNDVHVPWDTDNNRVRGFAYINSTDEEAVYKLNE